MIPLMLGYSNPWDDMDMDTFTDMDMDTFTPHRHGHGHNKDRDNFYVRPGNTGLIYFQ
jgi:hypothetical protein